MHTHEYPNFREKDSKTHEQWAIRPLCSEHPRKHSTGGARLSKLRKSITSYTLHFS